MTVLIRGKPTPMTTTSVQPGGLHTSSIEIDLAQQTTSMWYSQCHNRISYFYPDQDIAPYANITALDTWTAFVFPTDSVPFYAPWFMQVNFDNVSAMLMIATSEQTELNARLTSDDLITSVATATGPFVVCQDAPASNLPRADWDYMPCVYSVPLRLSPTVGGTHRDCSIIPQIRKPTPGQAIDNTSHTFKVYMVGLLITDTMNEPTE